MTTKQLKETIEQIEQINDKLSKALNDNKTPKSISKLQLSRAVSHLGFAVGHIEFALHDIDVIKVLKKTSHP